MIGVYKIKCSQENIVYIGSSIDINRRWNQHIRALNSNKHYNTSLQLAWDAYGSDSFIFNVLEETSIQNLITREQYYIDSIGIANCYNTASIASNPLANPKILSKSLASKQKSGSCITENIIISIKELCRDTELTDIEIAKIVGTNNDTVSNIRTGKTWKNIDVEGFKPYKKQLSVDDVIQIKNLFKNTSITDVEIARLFNVSRGTINHIRLGNTWINVQVPGFTPSKRRVSSKKPTKEPYHKLSESEVLIIKKILEDKSLTVKELATKFKVSITTIYDIRLGRTWNRI